MFLPKLPDDYSYGLLFYYAKGKAIDEVYGKRLGLTRRRFEPDVLYKRRLAKKFISKNLGGDALSDK